MSRPLADIIADVRNARMELAACSLRDAARRAQMQNRLDLLKLEMNAYTGCVGAGFRSTP